MAAFAVAGKQLATSALASQRVCGVAVACARQFSGFTTTRRTPQRKSAALDNTAAAFALHTQTKPDPEVWADHGDSQSPPATLLPNPNNNGKHSSKAKHGKKTWDSEKHSEYLRIDRKKHFADNQPSLNATNSAAENPLAGITAPPVDVSEITKRLPCSNKESERLPCFTSDWQQHVIAAHRAALPTAVTHKAADVACTSGQAAVALSQYFRRVIGIPCPQSIAGPSSSVRDALPLEDASVDFLHVSQANALFKAPWFLPEVWRVLTPGGSLVVTSCNLRACVIELDPEAPNAPPTAKVEDRSRHDVPIGFGNGFTAPSRKNFLEEQWVDADELAAAIATKQDPMQFAKPVTADTAASNGMLLSWSTTVVTTSKRSKAASAFGLMTV
eukprot:m.20325 g.20325  ORF g.20325 m.20325 type:complete len:387 (-) comp6138_c0_seq1:315-1475(-)